MISVEIPYIEILAEVLLGREDRRVSRSDTGPILAVTALVVVSVVMSVVFASYTVGLFYGAYQRKAIDIAVLSSSKIEDSGGRAMWSITLALRNSEEYPIEILYIDLSAGSAAVRHQISMSPGTDPLLKVYPSEVRLVDIVISNYNITQKPGRALVFIDSRFSAGMWLSVRLVDHSGNTYNIGFPLP